MGQIPEYSVIAYQRKPELWRAAFVRKVLAENVARGRPSSAPSRLLITHPIQKPGLRPNGPSENSYPPIPDAGMASPLSSTVDA
jgi:hypothetical protein